MALLLPERLRWHWVSCAFPRATFRAIMVMIPSIFSICHTVAGKNGASWKIKNTAEFLPFQHKFCSSIDYAYIEPIELTLELLFLFLSY